jgi:hypothetical protein
MVNLDDTSRCPVGREYEGCGRLEELAVLTGDTPVGVLWVVLADSAEVRARANRHCFCDSRDCIPLLAAGGGDAGEPGGH